MHIQLHGNPILYIVSYSPTAQSLKSISYKKRVAGVSFSVIKNSSGWFVSEKGCKKWCAMYLLERFLPDIMIWIIGF